MSKRLMIMAIGWLLCCGLVLQTFYACAAVTNISHPPLIVEEADGSPSVKGTWKLIVDNGKLTESGGVATLDLSGGGGGGYTQGSVPFADSGGDLTEDNANLFWDDSNNRLGIGTAAPNYRLHIHIAGSAAARIQISDGSTGSGVTDGFHFLKDNAQAAYVWNYENTAMHFGTNNTERMTISADGNIGFNNQTTFGTNLAGGAALANGTAATAVITDGVQIWADDYAAGDSRLYIMGEGNTDTVIIGGGDIVLAATQKLHLNGDEDTYIYEGSAGAFEVVIDGTRRLRVDVSGLVGNAGRFLIEDSTPSSENPNILPANNDVDTGLTRSADDAAGIVSGGVEAQRWTEVSQIIESNASVCQDNSGLELKTVAVHGLAIDSVVQAADGTGGLCTGLVASTNYYVLAVGTTTTATLSATRGGSIIAYTDTGTAFTSYNLEITGNLYGDMTIAGVLTSTPTTFTFTTEVDITPASTVVLLDGDNDGDADTLDLQDGTTEGQILKLRAHANIDVDDPVTIGMGDTTCTNCGAIVFDKLNENADLYWAGSTWTIVAIVDAL